MFSLDAPPDAYRSFLAGTRDRLAALANENALVFEQQAAQLVETADVFVVFCLESATFAFLKGESVVRAMTANCVPGEIKIDAIAVASKFEVAQLQQRFAAPSLRVVTPS